MDCTVLYMTIEAVLFCLIITGGCSLLMQKKLDKLSHEQQKSTAPSPASLRYVGKRRRDEHEHFRRRYAMKREIGMEKKREKMERYHMGKEDVRVAATTLAPSSSSDASPSFPSFAPSHEVEDVGDVPRHTVGDVLLLEANTNGRG